MNSTLSNSKILRILGDESEKTIDTAVLELLKKHAQSSDGEFKLSVTGPTDELRTIDTALRALARELCLNPPEKDIPTEVLRRASGSIHTGI